ncbi:hypothetical protein C8F04DRAFT_1230161 [Mycena alexandri]|uniref:F-box domain-containing protein n=1 Tax=Mycena alexandri TaxID=1745969 RepID=A0AAD6XE96_9AGAR|nr:hypothetical protein C8F04DRAFT_1230161 [Mycena alexandri]
MPIHFLDLPPEILILIISHLDLPTLAACLATNRLVKFIIDDSTLLQYRLAAQASCVEDNPWNIEMESTHKLAALRKHQAFFEWAPTSICFIELDDIEPGNRHYMYGLSGCLFVIAELDSRFLRWISPAATEPVLQRFKVPGCIQDITLAIPEEDLLVVVLSSDPLQDRISASDVVYELRFYEMSTQSAHRMAREPVMHVHISGARRPDRFEGDICGPRFTLMINYFDAQDDATESIRSLLLIYDWKLGCLLKSFRNYSAAIFLSPDVLLLAQNFAETLEFEMWAVSQDTAVGPCISLLLPPPVKGGIYDIICIVSKPKGDGSSASQAPFHSSFANSNVGFEIVFQLDGDIQEQLLLVISRRALLQLLPSVEDRGIVLLWNDRGPSIAQWLDKSVLNPGSSKTICGQRCAFIGPAGRIRLVDFNPYSYKQVLNTERDDSRQMSIQTGLTNMVVSPRERNRAIGSGLFEEEVRSNLGYLVVESAQGPTYSEVFMGDELIVGFKDTIHVDRKASLYVWRLE